MEREEALEKLSNIEIVEGDWVIGYHLVPTEELINHIYNDHEEQLKAKDEELERLKAELEEANEIIDDYAEVQAQMTP